MFAIHNIDIMNEGFFQSVTAMSQRRKPRRDGQDYYESMYASCKPCTLTPLNGVQK